MKIPIDSNIDFRHWSCERDVDGDALFKFVEDSGEVVFEWKISADDWEKVDFAARDILNG